MTDFNSGGERHKRFLSHTDVGDSDDLQYLFSFDKLNISLSKDEDLFVSRIMVDLWTSFAATG